MVTPQRPNRPRPTPPPPPRTPPKRATARPLARLGGLNPQGTVVVVAAVVIVVVIGLVGYGLWDTYVRPARQVAVRVGDVSYDMGAFVKRFKLELEDPGNANLTPTQLAALPEQFAQTMRDEEVLLQRAYPVLGVGVSDGEIDAAIAEQLRTPVVRDESGNVQRASVLNNAVRAKLEPLGLTVAEYRRAVHGGKLRDALLTYFTTTKAPTTAKSAKARVVVVADEAKAKELKQQIESGADMAQIAREQSLDSLTKADGGLRPDTPQGLLPAELDGPLFKLELGQLSDPILSADRWVLLRVEERTDTRDLSEQERQVFATKYADEWIAEQAKSLNARQYLSDDARKTYTLEQSGALSRLSQPRTGLPNVTGQSGGITIPGGAAPVPVSGGGR